MACLPIIILEKERSSSIILAPEECSEDTCRDLDTTSLKVEIVNNSSPDPVQDRTLPNPDGGAENLAFARLMCDLKNWNEWYCLNDYTVAIVQTRVSHECFGNFGAAAAAKNTFDDPDLNWRASTMGGGIAQGILNCLCSILRENSSEEVKAGKIGGLATLIMQCGQDRINDCECTDTVDYDVESALGTKLAITLVGGLVGGPYGAALAGVASLLLTAMDSPFGTQAERLLLCLSELLDKLYCD